MINEYIPEDDYERDGWVKCPECDEEIEKEEFEECGCPCRSSGSDYQDRMEERRQMGLTDF